MSLRTILQRENLLVLVLLSWSAVKVQAECPLKCLCPSSSSCPPGVSSVLDSCGCCRQCARQYNQDCGPKEPCDHIKGLRCHLGAGGDPQRGLCRAEAHGRPCELDGRLYQHGEDFQPSCEHRCSCMDGVVGCIPLCPPHIPLPDWHCAQPRLTTSPGRCCQEWVCDDDNRIDEDDLAADRAPQKNSDLMSNELLVSAPKPWDSSAGASLQEWISSSQSHALVQSTCFLQTTDWSPCSATCGMGVSSRVTNNNAECRLIRETRLCQIQECGGSLSMMFKTGKRCQRTVRPHQSVPIRFSGCSTVRRYRPRYCGSCVDGRGCAPSLTRTVTLRFRCPQGDAFSRRYAWILQCSCSWSSNSQRNTRYTESLSLPNDIHTFTH